MSSSSNDSSYANPGIYRQSIEEMMYTPSRAAQKREFHDETLTSLKKVTTLLQKFQNGEWNSTEDSMVEHGVQKEAQEQKGIEDVGEDMVDGSAHSIHPMLYTPTPKPRSIRTPLRAVAHNTEEQTVKEISPILQETPILRSMSRQFSGSSFIESRFRMKPRSVEEEAQSWKTTKSLGSSSYTSDSSENEAQESEVQSAESFNTANQFYYSKFARAQVHHKFEYYYKWEPETLHTCAATVSDMRHKTLESIPQHEQDDRVKLMKTIYSNCKKGVNKEMDALCCSLFDLLDDVSEKRLSIHEEYAVGKYSRKMQGK